MGIGMARTLKSDRTLFGSTLLLVAASVIMVYSASAVQAEAKYSSAGYFLYKQLAWVALGVVAMLVVMRIDYRVLRRPEVIWPLVGVVVLGLLAVFAFKPVKGAQRWIPLSVAKLQPAELAKLVAIVFAAALLDRRMHRINDLAYALAPIAVVTIGFGGLIVLEPDFGTALMMVASVVAMVFAAGLSYRYLAGLFALLVPALIGLIALEPYRVTRFFIFLDPWKDPMDKGFQAIQALIAVGSGGVLGKGLMAGVQKIFYIPEPHTDFIYAVIGEEVGLVGTSFILICFILIAWRGFRAAVLAPDRFGSLLALGLTTLITLQALVNMSMVIGLLPTEGVPLPFVSNGGSSLAISLIGMGILLNISQQSSRVLAAGDAVLGNGSLGGWTGSLEPLADAGEQAKA
jgi:cell division protein FtsW